MKTATKEFHHRLKQACDDNPSVIPPYGYGRQVYIAEKLDVTQEAVRKWFVGKSRPRVDKMRKLAQLLDVDEAWLSLGIKSELDRRQRWQHRERTEGAVHVLFGLLTMAGGHCAFPSPDDPRAEYVDFYTIFHGTQIAIHVSVARKAPQGGYKFILPREHHDVRTIGVIHLGGTRFHLVDLRAEIVEKHKKPEAEGFSVTLSKKPGGVYRTGRDHWPRVHNMQEVSGNLQNTRAGSYLM